MACNGASWVHLIEHGADREDVASRVIFFGDVTVSRSRGAEMSRTSAIAHAAIPLNLRFGG